MFMSDDNRELEPVDVKELMAEFAEMSFADLVLEHELNHGMQHPLFRTLDLV